MKIICFHKERAAYHSGLLSSPFHLKSILRPHTQSTQRSMPRKDINFVLLTKKKTTENRS